MKIWWMILLFIFLFGFGHFFLQYLKNTFTPKISEDLLSYHTNKYKQIIQQLQTSSSSSSHQPDEKNMEDELDLYIQSLTTDGPQ